MAIILGIMAGIIFLLYSIYIFEIIRGEPDRLESELIKSLTDWIVFKGAGAKSYLWAMYALSVLIEVLYFYLTLTIIGNPVMRVLTIIMIPLEIFHLALLGLNFQRFFTGKYVLSQLFVWRVERMSAMLFFTHTLLVMVSLVFFS